MKEAGHAYDCIAMHVDNLLIITKDAKGCMDKFKQCFKLRTKGHSLCFLRYNIRWKENRFWETLAKTSIKKAIAKTEKACSSMPLAKSLEKVQDHPKSDRLALLSKSGMHLCQMII